MRCAFVDCTSVSESLWNNSSATVRSGGHPNLEVKNLRVFGRRQNKNKRNILVLLSSFLEFSNWIPDVWKYRQVSPSCRSRQERQSQKFRIPYCVRRSCIAFATPEILTPPIIQSFCTWSTRQSSSSNYCDVLQAKPSHDARNFRKCWLQSCLRYRRSLNSLTSPGLTRFLLSLSILLQPQSTRTPPWHFCSSIPR